MKLSHLLAVPALILALAGCADFPPGNTGYIDALTAAKPSGPGFGQQLAADYLNFAKEELGEDDWMAQQRYAKKGLDALNGAIPAPEKVEDWSIDDAAAAKELTEARAQLTAMLAGDGPKRLPARAATAQVQFECWLHEQWEGWQKDEIDACKLGFHTAMGELAAPAPKAEAPAPAPAPAPAAAPIAQPKPADQYMVFFDWDKSFLTAEAKQIVAAAAKAAREAGYPAIKVTGYTDLSGPVGYNLRLSVRRAKSVQAELIADGVPAAKVTIEGKGKSDPLVPTADGVREPKNRRAVIDIKIGG